MLSQIIVIKDIRLFYRPSVLGIINMDIKIANNDNIIKINTDYRQQFSKLIKEGCTVFRWSVNVEE